MFWYVVTSVHCLGKKEMKKKLGMGLTFHDETPSTPSLKFATVPSEFHQKPADHGKPLVPLIWI